MGLRRFPHVCGSCDPFEPDPVDTGVGKGDRANQAHPSTAKEDRISHQTPRLRS